MCASFVNARVLRVPLGSHVSTLLIVGLPTRSCIDEFRDPEMLMVRIDPEGVGQVKGHTCVEAAAVAKEFSVAFPWLQPRQ